MIESAIAQHLVAAAAVSAINGDRVHPLVKPQNKAGTALVYSLIGQQFRRTVCGTKNLIESRVQIDCWAGGYKTAKQLAAAVRDSLDFYRGDLYGTQIDRIIWQNESDGFESDVKVHRVIHELVIYHH